MALPIESLIINQAAQSGLELWHVFLVLAIVCFLIGVARTATGRPKSGLAAGPRVVPGSEINFAAAPQPTTGDFALEKQQTDPLLWNEASISRDLAELRDQAPAVVTHYIESVKSRWVLNQNDKTAVARARFLKTKVEELKLFKEGKQIVLDLEALALEREKRLKTLQLENTQLDEQMRSRSQREQLVALKERKQLELEIAQLDQQIECIKKPPKVEPRRSPEQERAKRHAESDRRLGKLKEEKQKAALIEDEHERNLKVHAIDDEIEREMIEWSKTLP
jgi:hypothetical protein